MAIEDCHSSHAANCGSPPNGSDLNDVVLSGPVVDTSSTIVANEGAMAAYTCLEGFILMGEEYLVCTVNVTAMTAIWSPNAAPTCVPGEKQFVLC